MKKIETIIVDPGHGGDDNGAAYGYDQEDDINLAVAQLLYYELLLLRYRPVLTRTEDVFVPLSKRVARAKVLTADLFVSIHCDAFHTETAKGMSFHIYPGSRAGHELAAMIHMHMRDNFPDHQDRGIRESNFYVLRKTECPAVLVECEFLSHPETRLWLHEPANHRKIAMAIAMGIDGYAKHY